MTATASIIASDAYPTAAAGDRVCVQVLACDPVSEVGVLSQLRPRPEVRLAAADSAVNAQVSVVVTDSLDSSTLQLLRSLRHGDPARVVLVVGRLNDDDVMSAAELGVVGVVRRCDATADRLVDVIRRAARGEASLPPDLVSRLMTEIGRAQREDGGRGPQVAQLARRELDVLRLIADGYDTIEIGKRLSFSERTIKNIVNGVTTRFNLRNRSHAVAYALRQGLL